MTDLRRQSLGEMTDEDARSEGYPGLEPYQQLILRMHPGMEWDTDRLVWVHEFQPVQAD